MDDENTEVSALPKVVPGTMLTVLIRDMKSTTTTASSHSMFISFVVRHFSISGKSLLFSAFFDKFPSNSAEFGRTSWEKMYESESPRCLAMSISRWAAATAAPEARSSSAEPPWHGGI